MLIFRQPLGPSEFVSVHFQQGAGVVFSPNLFEYFRSRLADRPLNEERVVLFEDQLEKKMQT